MIPLEQCATILNKGKEKYDNRKDGSEKTKIRFIVADLIFL